MQLIKEKHRSTGNDFTMKIVLGTNSNLNGLQQSINDFIERETGLSINPVTDGETFRYKLNTNETLNFNFLNSSNQTFSNTLINAGFTSDEIDNNDNVISNSFYILQVYDSINRENQTLLHNSYYNGSSITDSTSTYTIRPTDEFSNFYIPESFINSTNSNTIDLYCTFLFFNAKNGKLQIFLNENKENITTEDKMYYGVTLNKTNMTYSYNDNGTIELKESANTAYVDVFNESLDKFNNEIPQFPSGKLFTDDGKYENIT